MTSILLGACVLACPLVMGVMMFAMRRGAPQRKRSRQPAGDSANEEAEIAE